MIELHRTQSLRMQLEPELSFDSFLQQVSIRTKKNIYH